MNSWTCTVNMSQCSAQADFLKYPTVPQTLQYPLVRRAGSSDNVVGSNSESGAGKPGKPEPASASVAVTQKPASETAIAARNRTGSGDVRARQQNKLISQPSSKRSTANRSTTTSDDDTECTHSNPSLLPTTACSSPPPSVEVTISSLQLSAATMQQLSAMHQLHSGGLTLEQRVIIHAREQIVQRLTSPHCRLFSDVREELFLDGATFSLLLRAGRSLEGTLHALDSLIEEDAVRCQKYVQLCPFISKKAESSIHIVSAGSVK